MDRPLVAVDTVIEKEGRIVLIRRKKKPFKNYFSLPGGFVDYCEYVEDAAIRETKEETNLDVKLKEILGIYSDPKRDPRGPVISIVFIAKPLTLELKGKDDAKEAKWFEINKIPKKLAFDHSKILSDYLKFKSRKQTFWSKK